MFWVKAGAKNIFRKGRNIIIILLIGLFGGFLIITKNSMVAFMQSWEDSIIKQKGHIIIAPEERFTYSGFLSEQFFIENPKKVIEKIYKVIGEDLEDIIQNLSIVGYISSPTKMSFAFFKGVDAVNPSIKEWHKIENIEGAVIGYTLAKYLGVGEGDEITIMANAVDGFPNALGINIQKKVLFGEKFADSSLVILPIEDLKNLINADVVSHISIYLKDKRLTGKYATELRKTLGEPLGVKTWDEVIEEFKFMKAFLNVQLGVLNFFLTIITFIVALFFSLLAIKSDHKEIGTLRALGVSKKEIFILYGMESILVATFGTILGLLIGYMLTAGLSTAGIPFVPPGATITIYIRPDFDPLSALSVVRNLFVFTLIGWFIAIIRALKISPVEAFRDV